MAGVRYTTDGHLVKPRLVTIFQMWAKTTGGGHIRLEATSTAELWTNYYDGQRRGIYCGVIGTDERTGEDPAEAAAYRAELARVWRTSCPLVEDYLLMRRFVKTLPPERYEEIDTTWLKGLPHVETWLASQRSLKSRLCVDTGLTPAPRDPRPWWERDYPWRIDTDAAMAQ